jgi:hypothetical protein
MGEDLPEAYKESAKKCVFVITPGDKDNAQDKGSVRCRLWLSRHGCVHNIVRQYVALLATLQEVSGDDGDEEHSAAGTLYGKMADLETALALHHCCDILQRLTALSKAFQSRQVVFGSIKAKVSSTSEWLKQTYVEASGDDVKYGPCYEKFLSACKEGQYQSYMAVLSDSDLEAVVGVAATVAANFAKACVSGLDERFPVDSMGVLDAACVLDPNFLPPSTQLRSYGAASFKALCEHFDAAKMRGIPALAGRAVDVDAALAEWDRFVHEFRVLVDQTIDAYSVDISKGYNHTLLVEVWAAILHTRRDEYPNICKIAENVLVAPVSSVECERGFSVQNHIKCKLRNRMAVDTLDMLMRVRLVGPKSFAALDLEGGVDKWFVMRQYRHISSKNKPMHWHLLAVTRNSKEQSVYVMWDDDKPSSVGPTFAGVTSEGADGAVAASEFITAAAAAAGASGTANENDDFASDLDLLDFPEFRAGLGALGVLQAADL